MIVWAAQTRVHYMFLVSRCRCNSFVHTLAALHKEVERDFRTAIRAALDDSRRRPRLPRVGLTGICNVASAHPPLNMSLQKRTGIACLGFDAGFGGLAAFGTREDLRRPLRPADFGSLLTTLKDTSHEEEEPLADR
jgi:hypothetical protein